VENFVLVLVLALVVLLPLAEVVVRKLFHSSISGVHAFVQHFTLMVGMVGGAVAAREARLLSLSTVNLLSGRFGRVARAGSAAMAAVVTVFLCVAALRFVMVERAAADVIAYGIPVWGMELALPVGFALVALRLVYGAADEWRGRLAVAGVTAVLASVAVLAPFGADRLAVPALLLLLLATLFGAPIFTVLGGAALILFWAVEVPIASVTVEHYRLATNPTLPALPLFALAGYFLAESGASHRLIRLFRALVGQFRGGTGVLTALVCAFFTSFTGASGVTILALGGLLMPALLAARYSERSALGLLTGTGSLGLLLPPCLPLILFAVIAQVDIVAMFLGGIIPGLLLVALTAAWAISQAPRVSKEGYRFDWDEVRRAVCGAKWELLIPVVALGSMFSGLATAVEAAALTAFYTFIVEAVVHRELSLRNTVPRAMTACGALVGGLLLILGVSLGFTNYLVDAQIPTHAVDWVTTSVQSPLVFLLLLNVFLIVVGALMDIYSRSRPPWHRVLGERGARLPHAAGGRKLVHRCSAVQQARAHRVPVGAAHGRGVRDRGVARDLRSSADDVATRIARSVRSSRGISVERS
jgi:tripartite ATP-independent transporter DctM subunit